MPTPLPLGQVNHLSFGPGNVRIIGRNTADPARWKRGIGRVLFGAAVTRAKEIKAGAIMIYAEPSAEGFYKRMGAIRIGEGPFYFSPETTLPHLLYVIPRET